MNTYRVYVSIEGAPWRPPYDGYVDIVAENLDQAMSNAPGRIKQTAFPDVPLDAIKVKGAGMKYESRGASLTLDRT